ncbi:MAG TPA: LuxR C-terminal-related transcriptional regulator [Thermomonospora sp.]|nr:LuxR C-terminal-related transcriptional regulator [Thermomonospora sp.]
MSEVTAVPPELSSFVGRAAELAAIEGMLAAGRALTLVGPGGCGKTRLALRTCREQAGRWPDGVRWAGLEHETDGGRVAFRVAEASGVPLPAGADPVAALVHALRDLSAFLVVDNCEHVLDAAAGVVAALLAGCPGIAVLATSRAPLGIEGERVWRVPAMDLADALDLFLERAGMTEAEAARSGARRVCDRLDRLPLALELAAGWAGTLTPAQIADSLGDPYTLLDGGARTAAFRQRTLEGSMRWSHDLLDEDERVLFRRLGVLEPGFGREAVAGLAALGPGITEGRALQALRGLVAKSLVVADTTGAEARYRMLGVVRAYALARLREAGEDEAARDRHLDVHLALVERWAPLLETDKDAWRARVRAEYPNVRAAIEWGLSRDDATRGRRLAAATAWLWHLEAGGAEGLRLLRRAAERGAGERSALQAEVLVAQALVADTAQPGGEGYQAAREARRIADEVGAAATGRLARSLEAVALLGSDLAAAREAALRSREDGERAGDGFVADSGGALAGLVHLLRDEHRAAIAHLEPALDGLLRRGDRGVASAALGWLALAAARTGDLPRAAGLAEDAVTTAEPLRDFHRVGMARGILAEVRVLQGRVEEAEAALAPIDRLVEGSGEPVFIPGWHRVKAVCALERGDPARAVRWCRREGQWHAEPDDAHLTPETRLVLAIALRESGDEAAAERVLTALAEDPPTRRMPRVHASALHHTALMAQATDTERALALHHEALRIQAEHDLVLDCAASLEALAVLVLRRGGPQQAGILLGAAQRARAEAGARPCPPAPDLAEESLERGRAMPLEEAIAYATRSRGRRRRPDSGWESLTPTERSVVDLAVQGLSNPDIAARLVMSRGTVKTHLAHVYAKLQVTNRTELARLAADRPTDRRRPGS